MSLISQARVLQKRMDGVTGDKGRCFARIAVLRARAKRLSALIGTELAAEGSSSRDASERDKLLLDREHVVEEKLVCARKYNELRKEEAKLKPRLDASYAKAGIPAPTPPLHVATSSKIAPEDVRSRIDACEMEMEGHAATADELQTALREGAPRLTQLQRLGKQKREGFVMDRMVECALLLDQLKKRQADAGDGTSTGDASVEVATSQATSIAVAHALPLDRQPLQPLQPSSSPRSSLEITTSKPVLSAQPSRKRAGNELPAGDPVDDHRANAKRRRTTIPPDENECQSGPMAMQIDAPTMTELNSSRLSVPKPAASSRRELPLPPSAPPLPTQLPPAQSAPAQPLPTGPSSPVDSDADVVRPLFKVEGLTEEEVADELGEAEESWSSSDGNGEDDDDEEAVVVPAARGQRQTKAEVARAARIQQQEAVLARLDEEGRIKIRARIAAGKVIEASSGTTRAKILGLINVSVESNGLPQFLITDEAFLRRTKKPAMRRHLLHRALHPFTLDVDQLVADGVFTKVDIDIDEERASDKKARYYMRWLLFEDVTHFRACLAAYGQTYADSILIATITEKLNAEIADGVLREDDPCGIGYDGTCIDATPAGRVLQDHDAKWSRVTNFIKVARACTPPPTYSSFEYESLQLDVTGTSDLLTNRLVGDIERVGIALTKDWSLNSANGGLREYVAPQLDAIQFVEDDKATLAHIDGILPRDAKNDPTLVAKQELLGKGLDDSLALYNSLDRKKVGTLVDPAEAGGLIAYKAIHDDAEALDSREGHVLSFLLSKDITLASINGVTQFAGETAAKGPHLYWQIEAMVLGMDVDTRDGIRALCGRAVFWMWGSVHVLVLYAIAFLSRTLHIVRPTLLDVQSSKFWNLLQQGFFRSVFNPTPSPERDSFFACGTASTIESLGRILRTFVILWKDTPCKGWIPRVGCVCVVRSGPYDVDVQIAIARIDTGYNMRDPRLQPLLVAVEVMIAVVGAIARRLTAEALSIGGPPARGGARILSWYRDLRARIQLACRDRGVTAELEKRRTLLVEVVNAITGARTRVALARDMAKKVDGGMTEQEVRRQRSAIMSETRLRSVGGARFEGEADPSADVEPFFTRPYLAVTSSSSRAVPLFDPARTANLDLSPRLKQLSRLLEDHREALLDGNDSPAPALLGSDVGDKRYVSWFLSRTKGNEILRSATQFGKVHEQPDRTEDEQAARTARYSELGSVREEKKREAKGTTEDQEYETVTMLRKLARDDAFKATVQSGSRRNVALFHCVECEDCWLGDLVHFSHRCLTADGYVKRKVDDPSLHRTRALFPHAYIAKALEVGKINASELQELLRDAGLLTYSSRHELARLDPTLLAALPARIDSTFYAATTTSNTLRIAMAVDALILEHTDAPDESLSSGIGDDWWWTGGTKEHDKLIGRMCHGVQEPVGGYVCTEPDPETGKPCDTHKVFQGTGMRPRVQHMCVTGKRSETYSRPVTYYQAAWELPRHLVRRHAYAFFDPKDTLRKKSQGKGLADYFSW